MRRALGSAIAVSLLGGVAAFAAQEFGADGPSVTWTMVDVTDASHTGDAHVIRSGGQTMLIDAGPYELGRSQLVPYLRGEGIDRLDVVFVSHAHDDHYGGVRALVESGIDIGRVEFSLPAADVCEREVPWGCNAADIDATLRALIEASVPVEEPRLGEVWDLGDGATLEVVQLLEGSGPPAGTIDVNDTSTVLHLRVGEVSVLFAGDLNAPGGLHLVRQDLRLEDTVLLKVPHHGAESLPPDEFFDRVDPDYAFVPADETLWAHERTARTRAWLSANDVPTFVSGEEGNVTVHLRDGDGGGDGDDGGGVRIETGRHGPVD